jgi:hypothetical protein
MRPVGESCDAASATNCRAAPAAAPSATAAGQQLNMRAAGIVPGTAHSMSLTAVITNRSRLLMRRRWLATPSGPETNEKVSPLSHKALGGTPALHARPRVRFRQYNGHGTRVALASPIAPDRTRVLRLRMRVYLMILSARARRDSGTSNSIRTSLIPRDPAAAGQQVGVTDRIGQLLRAPSHSERGRKNCVSSRLAATPRVPIAPINGGGYIANYAALADLRTLGGIEFGGIRSGGSGSPSRAA